MPSARGRSREKNRLAGLVVQYAYDIKTDIQCREKQKNRDIMTTPNTYIDDDPYPPIHDIVMGSEALMLKYLDIYRNPNTRFRVTTWRGGRVVTPLAMAVESTVRALNFPKVLSVLVNNAGINPNEPYMMDDLKKGLRIRTNALTHFLVRWEKNKSPECRTEVLHTLLRYGADARAPALYEVTPLVEGREIFEKQSMLCAASGQSLMAFQMSRELDVFSPSNFITDLIQMGHARFLPLDPDGLFVKWAREAYFHFPKWGIHVVMDFQCPSETTHPSQRRPIAGGLLAPGEEASGQLRRLVQSLDSVRKMNILHLFVACSIGPGT